jgi:uncharacterized cupin superfamily protein
VLQGYFPCCDQGIGARGADRIGSGPDNRPMRRFNVNAPVEYDPEPDGYRAGYEKLHTAIGGRALFGGLFELPPGQSGRPYHYESAEEWLLVLEGRVSVRTPEGTDELRQGDLVCFPAGPDGAHKVTNTSDTSARVLLVSRRTSPAVAVYPDSDKIGVIADWGERVFAPRKAGVDYYDRER